MPIQPGDTIVTLPGQPHQTNLSDIARGYIHRVQTGGNIEAHVVCRCECGHGEVVIDRLASETDARELVELMRHAAFDHASPHRIEETRVSAYLSAIY